MVPARKVLEEKPWRMNTSEQWQILPKCNPNDKTVHRRIQMWCASGLIRATLMDLANVSRKQGAVGESECNVDATFAFAIGGGKEIGPTKRGKRLKIATISERHGLPHAVITYAANHLEVTRVQLTFDF